MKYIIVIALCFAVIACDTPKEKPLAVQQAPVPLAVTTGMIPFSGSWVNTAYYSAIYTTLSPLEAQGAAKYVFIPGSYNDSTFIIYGFHEAGPYRKVVKAGDKYLWAGMESDEFAGTPKAINVINDSMIKIESETFVRISRDRIDEYKITELLLFKGAYTHNGQKVTLGQNGEVNGLDDFKYYEVALDYVDQGMNLDLVSFGSSKDDLHDFTFKFNHDTLSIYDAPCVEADEEGRCFERKKGELKYTLIKEQKQ